MTDAHPVRLLVSDDLRRSRLTVFFRYLLAIPHLIWSQLWGMLAAIVALINWIATIVARTSPAPLHNFLAAYLTHSTHVTAYMFLVANPFPGFSSKDAYPVSVEIDGPREQNRLSSLFRWPLAVPAAILASVLMYVLYVLALGSWFVGVALGRTPRGMRDFGAYCVRFQTQTNGYAMLVTSRYPSLELRLDTSDARA